MISNKIKFLKKRISQKYKIDILDQGYMRLKRLGKSCQEHIQHNNIQPTVKILWPTTFNLLPAWWYNDAPLICALMLRGAEIIPTMCNKLQSDQCMFHSGLWQDSFGPNFETRRKNLCNQCIHSDLKFWDWLGLKPIKLSNFVNENEKEQLKKDVMNIMSGDWRKHVMKGFPVGDAAYKAVVNNNLQGEILPGWQEEAEKMAADHMYNILALHIAYEKVFETIKPDRVVGNGGFYYFWGVTHHISQKKQIPYYRYYPIGLQTLSWNYAKNNSEPVDLTPAWKSWIKQPWSETHVNEVNQHATTRGLKLNEKTKKEKEIFFDKHELNSNIPTVLALTGVIWDATTNVKSDLFENMYEWLWKTIAWFKMHPEYQLIIRVHPGENVVPSVAPNERTFFEKELENQNIIIPNNVCIISHDNPINTYELMHYSDLAITYMSTSGLEYALLGKPIITIGPVHYKNKGFTLEPQHLDQYYNFIKKYSNGYQPDQKRQCLELAQKYWYLYAFHCSTVMGTVETETKITANLRRNIGVPEPIIKALSYKDLLPGKNEQLDYLCDTILKNLPILGDNRWPPKYTVIL